MRRAALWNHWHMDWYGHFVSERFILISMAFKREAEQIYLLFTVSNNKLGSMKRSSKKRPQHEMISFFTLSSGFYPLWCLTSNNGEVVRWTSGECQVNVRWTERHLICSSQMQFPLKLFLSPKEKAPTALLALMTRRRCLPRWWSGWSYATGQCWVGARTVTWTGQSTFAARMTEICVDIIAEADLDIWCCQPRGVSLRDTPCLLYTALPLPCINI